MIQAVSGAMALQRRASRKSKLSDSVHWRTPFIGGGSSGEIRNEPQAFLLEMNANEVLRQHFHQVDQFQIFVSGSGRMGRTADALAPIVVHYSDHHTGYGPIAAGPQGYGYFTLRAQHDGGATYIGEPGYRDRLKPSRKRHFTVPVVLSIAPVLAECSETTTEILTETGDDGLGASLLRMGPSGRATGPDPRESGGQYYLVLNGSLEYGHETYGPWSLVFVGATEPPFSVQAGSAGLEVLVLTFPKASH
ncbi:MAG: hypothetical protein Q8N51_02545 [Gammaproteobacteria bacterium]|nr:hypothetical protein [Gammaproteobacteria bacterium]